MGVCPLALPVWLLEKDRWCEIRGVFSMGDVSKLLPATKIEGRQDLTRLEWEMSKFLFELCASEKKARPVLNGYIRRNLYPHAI